MNVNISKSDVIFQNNVSRSHSMWINPLILSHTCSGAIESVENGGGEVNAATPKDPDWENLAPSWLILKDGIYYISTIFCRKQHIPPVPVYSPI